MLTTAPPLFAINDKMVFVHSLWRHLNQHPALEKRQTECKCKRVLGSVTKIILGKKIKIKIRQGFFFFFLQFFFPPSI